MKRKQQGFTLVEIAIVLVIIGLLLGGILKGQEMIAQAKIKNVIGDMSGVSAAMYGYQDRYRALPGDDKGAATRWASITGIAPGDGDGVVGGLYIPAAAGNETAQFWLHLRSAGFIAGTGTDNPFNAVSGKMGVQTGNGLYVAGTTPVGAVLNTVAAGAQPAVAGFTSLILCSANLPDKVAISVDAQTDDGNSLTGSVRGLTQAGQPNIPVTGAATAYVEDGVSSYVVCRTLI
ncbi:MAG: prepilin-type N-terminal cleavage/methylation domain-containing protein [Betaproteobacteria bacterium]|nr:prepilin-type N-terminal cleavage/methylation domain-containing protein [Betaproteobacteria bacterium]